MDTSGGTRVYTEMDNGSDAADEIAVSKKRPRKTYQGLCPLCGVTKEINHTANHRAVVIASQADPDTGPLFERHGVNTLDDSFHIVLKIRRPGTWWSRLLARMVRLLLPPPTRLHHPTLDPASQGPFGFGYITKLLVFSLKHENLSEDSTASQARGGPIYSGLRAAVAIARARAAHLGPAAARPCCRPTARRNTPQL